MAAATAWSPNNLPIGEREVWGEDEGGVFVSAGHELGEQVRSIWVEGQIADFVDDEPVSPEPSEFFFQLVSLMRTGEVVYPPCCGVEQHTVVVSCTNQLKSYRFVPKCFRG